MFIFSVNGRIDKCQAIIVAELTAETSHLIRHLNDNVGILYGCPAGWNKALIDFLLRQNPEAFAVNLSGDDAHGAVAAGTLAAAGGIDFDTGASHRVEERCIHQHIDCDPGWLKSYTRHNTQVSRLFLAFCILTKLSISAASWGPTSTFQPGRFSSSSPLIWAT